jgi:hypothetical protein
VSVFDDFPAGGTIEGTIKIPVRLARVLYLWDGVSKLSESDLIVCALILRGVVGEL